MSLFPAYSKQAGEVTQHAGSRPLDWLKNESYIESAGTVSAERASTADHESEILLPVHNYQVRDSYTPKPVSGEFVDNNRNKDAEVALKIYKREDEGTIVLSHRMHRHDTDHHKSKRKHKKHKQGDRKHREIKNLEYQTIGKSSVQQLDISSKSAHSIELPVDCSFTIDRKADECNFLYGSIYRKDIARYWRKGLSCLGLRDQEIFDARDGKKGAKHKDADDWRYFLKGIRITSDGELVRPNTALALVSSLSTSDLGYISLTTPVASAATAPLTSAASSAQAHLFSQTAEYNRQLRENETNVELWMEFIKFQDELFADSSTDISAALREVIGDGEVDKIQMLNRNKRAMITEIKLAIIEKALVKNADSALLHLTQLDLAEGVWESSKLAADWKNLVFKRANDPIVWRKYLRFVCAHFQSFSVSRMCTVYSRALLTLQSVVNGTLLTHKLMSPYTVDHMIDILDEICVVLREAGHLEKSIAIYQAQLELNLFSPSSPSLPLSSLIERLGSFWDSGRARLGEDDACGWGNSDDAPPVTTALTSSLFTSSKEQDEAVEQRLLSSLCNSPQHTAWVALESSRASRHWLPWRSASEGMEEEEECEDVERMIVFDDVTPYLFNVNSTRHKFRLLINFIKFLTFSLHCNFAAGSTTAQSNAPTIADTVWDVYSPTDVKTLFIPASPISFRHVAENMEQFIENVFHQTSSLFSGHFHTALTLIHIQVKVNYLFAHRELNATTEGGDGKRSAEIFKSKTKEVRQSLKRLLAQDVNRNNIALWEAYARFEWDVGNEKESRRVLDTALQLSSVRSDGVANLTDAYEQCIACRLYRTYASLELGLDNLATLTRAKRLTGKSTENRSKSISILVALVTGSSSMENVQLLSATFALKYRRMFEQQIDRLVEQFLSADEAFIEATMQYMSFACDGLVYWASCFAMFLYLSTGRASATNFLDLLISRLFPESVSNVTFNCCDSKIQFHEASMYPLSCSFVPNAARYVYRCAIYQSLKEIYIELIQFDVDRSVAAPLSVLREPLLRTLTEFPSHRILLQLLLNLEEGSHVTGTLNEYFTRRIHYSGRVGGGGVFDRGELDRRVSGAEVGSGVRKEEEEEVLMSSCLFAILTQLRRLRRLRPKEDTGFTMSACNTGVTHQLRAWLEKALQHSAVQQFALIWRLYFYFEATLGNADKVKTLFYRAVQQCPWAKNIYMDTIIYVPEMLQDILDLMTEKELRLRTPLEELDLLRESAQVATSESTANSL